MHRREHRLESPSHYGHICPAHEQIELISRDATCGDDLVILSDEDVIDRFRQGARGGGASETRARQLLEMLLREIDRVEAAARNTGDESLLYSPPYIRAVNAYRTIRAESQIPGHKQ